MDSLSTPQPPVSNSQDSSNAAAQLADILNSAIASIVSFRVFANSNWEYDYYSAGCYAVYGFTVTELMADKDLWRSRVHPEDWQTIFPRVFAATFAAQKIQYEYRFYHSDGSLRWIFCSSTARYVPEANHWVVTLVNTDITDRKRAEADYAKLVQELRDSQQLLQLVFDTLPQRVFWKDQQFKFLGCNKRFAQDAGLSSPEELIGKDDFDMIWRESAPIYRSDDAIVMQNNLEKINYEERQVRDDGTTLWLRTSKIPLRNEANKVLGIFGSYEDITDKKHQEDVIRNIALGVSAATGEKFFQQLVQYISKALRIEFVGVMELIQPAQTRARSIAFYGEGQTLENFEYDLAGTPCATMLNKQPVTYARNTAKLFPADPHLTRLRIEGYVSVPLLDSAGNLQGWLGGLSRQPLEQTAQMEEVLLIFAARASAELERRKTEQTLQRQVQRAQTLNRVTQAIRQTLHFSEIFATAAAEIAASLQTDRVSIVQYLVDRQCWRHVEEYRRQMSLIDTKGLEIPDADNPFADQLKRGQVVRVHNTDEIQDGVHRHLVDLFPGAWLLVPLRVSGKIWGSLTILHSQREFTWSEDEVELIQAIADQLSIAIQQANLYQQAQLEIAERQRAETSLQRFNQELEQRVRERTRALQTSLREKEVLFKEIHHRVKNNLQLISSLLSLQAHSIQDPQILEPFQDSQRRIRVIATIHEQLYRSDDLSQINFVSYINNLTQSLFQFYRVRSSIQLHVEIADLQLEIDTAISCGLIVNELVSNSIKYAFPDSATGTVTIRFGLETDSIAPQYLLIVQDDGIGISEAIEIHQADTLGLQIVQELTAQLDGILTLDRTQGTTFVIHFPTTSPSSC